MHLAVSHLKLVDIRLCYVEMIMSVTTTIQLASVIKYGVKQGALELEYSLNFATERKRLISMQLDGLNKDKCILLMGSLAHLSVVPTLSNSGSR